MNANTFDKQGVMNTKLMIKALELLVFLNYNIM